MPLTELLHSLGIKAKKRHVYLALLEYGTAKPSQIAKKLSIGRTTAHEILKSLTRDGLVSYSFKRGKYEFCAEPPEKIKQLLEHRITLFDETLPELNKLYASNKNDSTLSVIDNPDSFRSLLNEALESKEKTHRFLGSFNIMRKILGEMPGYAKLRRKKRIFRKSLLIQGEEIENKYAEKQNQYWREVKFLPKQFNFPNFFLAYDDVVLFFVPGKENIALKIKNADMASMMRQFFDYFWEIL